MGCPPVAPLSIITLAYLESQHIGYDKCKRGMRRLIDDIIVDLDIISEVELRSAYPTYLELNDGDKEHFLDVQYTWVENKFVHFPYVKPHVTVPLNVNSCHPWHILRSSVKNELHRMRKLCSDKSFILAWTKYWRTRYTLAGYNADFLSEIENEVEIGIKRARSNSGRGVNHVEVWRGTETGTASLLQRATQHQISKTWKVERSLLSLALKAHTEKKERVT